MTETTDIKALIKSAMLSCAESFCMEIADSLENEIGRNLNDAEHKQVTDAVSDLLHSPRRVLAEQALDQLEAERQRTCEMTEQYLDRNAALTSATLRYEKAEAELAEMRGTQEPDHYRYSCGSCGYETLAYTAKCPTCNYHKIEEEPLFTLQPKPVVVLPKLTVGEVMHRSGFDRQYAEGWVSANDWAINELKLAGIVVKDGE